MRAITATTTPPTRLSGFTLVEVMITVVIVSILAAIALPSYTNYIVRSHRAVGKSALMEMSARQEAYLADRKSYAASLNLLGYPAATTYVDTSKEFSSTAGSSIYTLTVSASTATTYTITATQRGSQTRDTACKTLSINQLGVKTAIDSNNAPSTVCWK